MTANLYLKSLFAFLLTALLAANLAPGGRFVAELPPTAQQAADKYERDEKLQADANSLLPLFDNMPPVPFYVTDETITETGSNTEKGIAYTHCYDHENPAVFVKKSFYKKTNRKQLTNALKHELTHAWLCRQRLMAGHDERFRRKFAEVGGFGN